jgi:hypothetical protein
MRSGGSSLEFKQIHMDILSTSNPHLSYKRPESIYKQATTQWTFAPLRNSVSDGDLKWYKNAIVYKVVFFVPA